MNAEAKKRVVALVDGLKKSGKGADSLSVHPETAQKYAINATHVDLGSETLFHDDARIIAELTHPEYGTDDVGKRHPHAPAAAAKIAAERSEKLLRRPGVILEVKLDPSMAKDKFRVEGTPVDRHALEG
jgi:hypothetical protein